MASIDRTAYPRLGKQLSASELETLYAVTDEEARLVRRATNGDSPRLTFLTLLKTRQYLGYFPAVREVPDQVIRFLADSFGLSQSAPLYAGCPHRGRFRLPWEQLPAFALAGACNIPLPFVPCFGSARNRVRHA